jgi:hypothetical protein
MWFIDSILIHSPTDLKITADPPDLHLFFTIPKERLDLIGFTSPSLHSFRGVLKLRRAEAGKMSGWFRNVCRVSVGEIVSEKRHIIAVDASTPLGTVLNLLQEEKIQSVPVYGAQGSWLGSGGVDLVSNHRQYIGIVSMIDLLIFILNGNPETVLNHRIVDAIGSTNESRSLWVEPASRPLYFALEQFCKGFRSLSLPILLSP